MQVLDASDGQVKVLQDFVTKFRTILINGDAEGSKDPLNECTIMSRFSLSPEDVDTPSTRMDSETEG